jgi:radical SAM/Cys-rich protein
MLDTLPYLQPTDFPAIKRRGVETLQVNLGYRCNQQCQHCHVNAGPNRKEVMTAAVIDDVMAFIEQRKPVVLDLTGGAPELHPQFRELVGFARSRGVHVLDRCNLTVLFESDQQGLAEFLTDHRVEIIASMPCYLEENVDAQRGKGVFGKSIEGLRLLNGLGYGIDDDKRLNLVYNPQSAVLPPAQVELEAQYKEQLQTHFGLYFHQLFTITNMPIKRFGSMLLSKGEFHQYMALLKEAYQRENLGDLMCRDLISVDWQGYVYDCDFNQMLGLPFGQKSTGVHLSDLMQMDFAGMPITIADHCYGCTAGQGSSCGGALAD